MSQIRTARPGARLGRAHRAGRIVPACATAGVLAIGLALATSAEGSDPDPATPALAIAVTRPTSLPATLTHGTTVSIAGTLQGATTALWLRNSTSRGARRVPLGAPDAQGLRHWSMQAVPLQAGRNLLALAADDAAGHGARRYLSVTRVDDAAADAAPPQRAVTWHGRTVAVDVRHGHAFIEGDIDLGDARWLASSASAAKSPPPPTGDSGIGIADSASFWPKVAGVAQIPYVISQGNDNVAPAIAQYNAQLAGVIQFVARGTETAYVDFVLDPNDQSGTGESQVGRTGVRQVIGGSILVNQATLLHEMGHATGLWHEQSRPDRDAFITILAGNILKTQNGNFDVQRSDVQTFGLYDHQSIMHYIPFAFSKNGEPTLETIPAGIRLSDLDQMSVGDLDAIKRLYGQAPGKVTITSNPPGLQVIVDGATVTTPQSFTYVLGSQHTLAVPANAQALGGDAYVYGRWNDATAASHTITIAPGNGLEAAPAAKPAVTVYQANFVQMLPFAPFVYPTGAGTVTGTPAPQSLPGVAGVYYPARGAVSLRSTGTAGYTPYRTYTAYEPASLNPKTTRNPDWVLAYFTTHPNITVGTAPTGRWQWVDGTFYYGPVNWSSDYPADGDWSTGTTHSLAIEVNPQLPFSWSIRYPWTTWSDGGALAHDVVSTGTATTYTANFGTQFNFASWAAPGCGGSVTATPAAVDNFYDQGSSVSFDEMPVPGWTFSGWQQDLSGATHPQVITMSDERLVVAGYNTSATPLAVTGFAPGFAAVGTKSLALTITGTGFTSATRLFINGAFVVPTKATATSLKTKLTAAQLKSAGGVEISVDNVPAGSWPCSNYVLRTFPVLAKGALPQVSPSVARLSFAKQNVGTGSPPQAVTLTNGGAATAALYTPALAGANAGDFTVANNCTGALAASAQCALTVTFTPTAKGARSASLLLLDSAFDSPQVVTLSGTGS